MKIRLPIEVQEYQDACDRLFCTGIDTPAEVAQIRREDYHNAWKRLLNAGYTPEEVFQLEGARER